MKNVYYNLFLASGVVLITLVTQSIIPIVPYTKLEYLEDYFYDYLAGLHEPRFSKKSRIGMISIGQDTVDELGWPIAREEYIRLLELLEQKAESPWILSYLQFQSVNEQVDLAWQQKVSEYNKFIGSPLNYNPDVLLDDYQSKALMKSVLLTRENGIQELPDLPFEMREPLEFIKSERSFGFVNRYGSEKVVFCSETILSDLNGDFAFPSSLIMTAAHILRANLIIDSGASWSRVKNNAKRIEVSSRQCIPFTHLTTKTYLEKRYIEDYELIDILEGESLSGEEVIILGSKDMRRYRGPGNINPQDDGVVHEYVLNARLLDAVIEGVSINRPTLSRKNWHGVLPFFWGALFIILSVFISLKVLPILSLGLLLVHLIHAYLQMSHSYVFDIYIQSILFLLLVALYFLGFQAFLAFHGYKLQLGFSDDLRLLLGRCQTVGELNRAIMIAGSKLFENFRIGFQDFDMELYEAAADPKLALSYLRKQDDASLAESTYHSSVGEENDSVRNLRAGVNPKNQRVFEMRIASNGQELASAMVSLSFSVYQKSFIDRLVDIMQREVSTHWYRIKLVSEQRIQDYKFVMEKSRSEAMSQFVPDSLARSFLTNPDPQTQLSDVLKPRTSRVALLQADIRGFTKMFALNHPMEVLDKLQSYYQPVIDVAEKIAQVKLMGDCIFLFIEEKAFAARTKVTIGDAMFALAKTLVEETHRINTEVNQQQPIHFGIAIHFGEVIVGNLSSKNCIDYTVIGKEVNMTARIEELTKKPEIQNKIGKNGILISEALFNELRHFRQCGIEKIELVDYNLAVRSFPEVKRVYYISAEVIMKIEGLQRFD